MRELQDDLPHRLERFYDTVPRADANVETLGSFTIFVQKIGGFAYYARPSLGATSFDVHDVAAVRRRQRELGVPEAFEWQIEMTPALGDVLSADGLSVHEHPLQVLDGAVKAPPVPADVRLTELTASSSTEDLRTGLAAAHVAFAHGGMAAGDAGAAELHDAARDVGDSAVERCRERLAAGRALMILARRGDAVGAVASAQLAEGVAEIVGVATLPSYRRRGLGAAVTAAVADAATAAGAHTVFLSAGDDDIARMYARLGFARVGTAGIAEAR